ncbi:MYND-type domain-containing protein [Durusdinium trenchii]|uniref:MYND-type domain-containing protein n=1 Tax=Durusdinium trenchii TaxID=1381693 RepID=A0ABP0N373_9DINO
MAKVVVAIPMVVAGRSAWPAGAPALHSAAVDAELHASAARQTSESRARFRADAVCGGRRAGEGTASAAQQWHIDLWDGLGDESTRLNEEHPVVASSRWPEIPEAEGWTSDDLTEIWLQRLGLGEDGRVLGQRPLQEDEAWDLITSQQRLAPRFFGRNRFDGLLSVLRAWTSQSRWPLVMSARSQAHLTELPTLELCACLVWRVLSCAKQLRQQGHKRLIFLSIGAGDALVEACVALHLAAALGVPVSLEEEPRLKYGDFEISVVATDSDQDEVLRQNRVAEAPRELPVRRLDRRRAVRSASDLGPVYVFSSWMPMHACWCSDVLEDAGTQLVEMCFLSAPPELIQVPRQEVLRRATGHTRATQEVFPKTLCRWDFLAQGFEEGLGAPDGIVLQRGLATLA